MTSAVFSSRLVAAEQAPSKLSQIAARVAAALMESRTRSAARELRRREAFMTDLARRQDHSPLFLDQSEPLPFKI